jgi:hypothetical protein
VCLKLHHQRIIKVKRKNIITELKIKKRNPTNINRKNRRLHNLLTIFQRVAIKIVVD